MYLVNFWCHLKYKMPVCLFLPQVEFVSFFKIIDLPPHSLRRTVHPHALFWALNEPQEGGLCIPAVWLWFAHVTSFGGENVKRQCLRRSWKRQCDIPPFPLLMSHERTPLTQEFHQPGSQNEDLHWAKHSWGRATNTLQSTHTMMRSKLLSFEATVTLRVVCYQMTSTLLCVILNNNLFLNFSWMGTAGYRLIQVCIFRWLVYGSLKLQNKNRA